MSSAVEAEIDAVFTNTKNAEMLRQIFIEMGHPQPPTPIQTDNTTAQDIITNSIKQQKTRAMDMRFYWLRDRHLQKNTIFIGAQEKTIWVTITPNTIHPHITRSVAPSFSIILAMLQQVPCKGVLIAAFTYVS